MAIGEWMKVIDDVKYCKRCGAKISDLDSDNCDYFRHISVKYCPVCRATSDRLKTAQRVYNLRQRKKQKDKFRDEQLVLLKQENELLRQRIQKLREKNNV
jgi:hypothetical protein